MKRLSGLVLLLCLANFLSAQDMRMDTYCNPLNIDYTYMIYNSDKLPVHTVIGVPGIC